MAFSCLCAWGFRASYLGLSCSCQFACQGSGYVGLAVYVCFGLGFTVCQG